MTDADKKSFGKSKHGNYFIEDSIGTPHPYCITEKHITGEFMSLGDSEIKQLESKNGCMCGMYVDNSGNYVNGYRSGYHKCNVPYEEHTSDLVCFLKLSRNGTNDEANSILKELVDNLGENYIDGFSFIETKEKFRIN